MSTTTDTIKRFDQMTRDELLVAKATIDARLHRAKSDLNAAITRSRRGFGRLPDEEFDALQDRVRSLTMASQGAQTALALLSARTRPTFHAEFVAAAKRLLSRQSFDAIADEARRVIEMAA